MYCSAERVVKYTYIVYKLKRTGFFKKEWVAEEKVFMDMLTIPFCKIEEADELLELQAKEFASKVRGKYAFELADGTQSETVTIPWTDNRFGKAINELTLGQYFDVYKEYLNINNN